MYKLLIADDEQIVLDSIKFIIEKNFSDINVIGTARSGREAIEKAEAINPDIVFMDIKMPGINGIDAIREIKSQFPNVIFIVLTAYDQFDFAKEALNLGVAEYLLKPVNREKVIDTIRKSIETIRTDKEKRKKDLELKEKLESVLPVLESGFIYSVLIFEDNSRELENYKAIFDIHEDFGYIMTIEFGDMDDDGNISNRIGFSVKSHSFYPYFRDTIKSKCKCLVGPVMLNRIVVFVPSDSEDDEYPQRLEAVNIAEYVLNRLAEKIDMNFKIGIGRSYRIVDELSRSYEESLRAIRYLENCGTMHIMDAPIGSGIRSQYPLSKEKLLMEKAAAGETSASIEAFNSIFNWLVSEFNGSVQDIKERLIEPIVMLHRMALDYRADESGLFKRYDYLKELLAIEDLRELAVWCRERIENIIIFINAMREKKISSLILRARNYIDRNFHNEITLEDVSREVNISPHYFSKLFKEESGENFIDYLISVRMNKARGLLEEGGFSVKEISHMVGYGDPNYFSRIFKRIIGITPTEYKENIQNKT